MLDYEVKAMIAWQRAKAAVMKGVKDFFTDENGDTNMISIVVVLVVVLGLAILFKGKATSFVTKLWNTIDKKAGEL